MGILNRAAIKSEARQFIGVDTRWFKMFLACLPLYLITQGVSVGYRFYNAFNGYSIQYFNDYYQNSQDNGLSVFTTVASVILIPFTFAMGGYFLNHIRGFNPDWRSLYKEGFDNYGKYFTVGIITDITVFLWTLLLVIPGLIKAYAYSQVKYIIHDNNKLTASEAKQMSDIMTKGYKSDLFIRDLSFILWYLLIGITFGIASLYVTPYINVTNAMFYENLKKNAIETGLIAPEAFGLMANPYDEQQTENNFNSTSNATVYTGYENKNNEFVPVTSEDTFNPDIVDEAIEDEKAAPKFHEDVTHTVDFEQPVEPETKQDDSTEE